VISTFGPFGIEDLAVPAGLQLETIAATTDSQFRRTAGHVHGYFGFGTNYSINESLDLTFSYSTYLAGRNAHFGRALTIGTTWNFSTRRLKTSASSESTSGPAI
jgi:hypothetical protein